SSSMIPRPVRSTLVPYTTLFRSLVDRAREAHELRIALGRHAHHGDGRRSLHADGAAIHGGRHREAGSLRPPELDRRKHLGLRSLDRTSTSLNSSHVKISCAVSSM